MSDIQVPSLIIEPDVMQQANDTQSFNLAVPDTGVKRGKNKFGETAAWTEILNVSTSEVGIVPEGVNSDGEPVPERVYVKVMFNVAPETMDPKNVGRSVNPRYLINPLEFGNTKSKERIMSLMSIGKLNALLRACGFEIEPGVATDLGAYFAPAEDGQSQVSGKQVSADFKNYFDKNGTPRQDIVAFDSVGE